MENREEEFTSFEVNSLLHLENSAVSLSFHFISDDELPPFLLSSVQTAALCPLNLLAVFSSIL